MFTVQLAIDKTRQNEMNGLNSNKNSELQQIKVLLLNKLITAKGSDIIHHLTSSGMTKCEEVRSSMH